MLGEAVAALAAFAGLSIIVTWPLALHLGSKIYGYPGDSTGTIAFLWSAAHDTGYHLIGSHHITLTGAPFGWKFANALNDQWLFVMGPGVLATKVIGEVAAYNLSVLAGLTLSGAAMYWLVRRLGGAPLVAAWAGLAYTIFPWHLEKAQGHLTFVHLEGFPLLVLAVLAWYRRPDWKRALWIAGATAMLCTTAGYFGLVALVALAVLLPAAALAQRRRPGPRAGWRGLSVATAIGLAPLVILFGLSLASGGEQGVSTVQSVGDLSTYGARIWEFFLPSYRNPVFGPDVSHFLGTHLHGSNFSESSLYVGWIPLLLAAGFVVYALTRRGRLRGDQWLMAASLPPLGVVAVLFSLPSPFLHGAIPGPSRLLWELVPQFRVPARFIALVMTALLPLAALGLEALCRALNGRGGAGRFAAVALCVAAGAGTVTEFWVHAGTSEVGTAPAYYRAVEKAPPGALAEYPLAEAVQAVNSDYLFWQRVHHRPLVNGAATGSFAEAVGQSVINPVSPETPSTLAALGVTAIVVRPTTYFFSGGQPAPQKLGRGYKLLGRYPDGTSVWRVTARPAPAVATFGNGFSFTETPKGQPTSRWMIAPEAPVLLYAWKAGTYKARFDLASYGRPRTVRIEGDGPTRAFGVAGTRQVSVTLRLPRGRSQIRLRAQPGPQKVPDGRLVTVYVSNLRFLPQKTG